MKTLIFTILLVSSASAYALEPLDNGIQMPPDVDSTRNTEACAMQYSLSNPSMCEDDYTTRMKRLDKAVQLPPRSEKKSYIPDGFWRPLE